MSYVRWSSDDFMSDIYSYAHVDGGYATHVAARHIRPRKPFPPSLPWPPEGDAEWAAYWAREKIVRRRTHRMKRHPIGLPFDGETFKDDSEEEMVARWVMLRDAGYRIPEGLIEAMQATEARR